MCGGPPVCFALPRCCGASASRRSRTWGRGGRKGSALRFGTGATRRSSCGCSVLSGGDGFVLPDGAVRGFVAGARGRATVPAARAAFLLRRAAWELIVSPRALDHRVREYAGSVAAPPPAEVKETIREIVREYLLEHPEIIEKAMIVLNAKRRAEKRAKARAAIAENRAALLEHPLSPVSGNPDGDVTLVEFFDDQCGFCKRSLEPVMDLLKSDAGLRIVWKEFPVLGPVSRFAARASMAAAKQGKYLAFHEAAMGTPGKLSEDAVLAIAERVGLDVARLRRDMADPALEAYLDETRRLADALEITGTPAFVIGGVLVPGAVGRARLARLIAEARSGG